MAGQVKQLPGAIGYVELVYAHQNKMPFADMKNAAGNFITASLDSVTEALATAQIPEDFRFSMVNPPGDKAYPISGATWLLVYEQQKDADKGRKLVEFLKWSWPRARGWVHRSTMRHCRRRCSTCAGSYQDDQILTCSAARWFSGRAQDEERSSSRSSSS